MNHGAISRPLLMRHPLLTLSIGMRVRLLLAPCHEAPNVSYERLAKRSEERSLGRPLGASIPRATPNACPQQK